jgi:hypothetical protein
MSKFEIRSPLLITAALALAPALAFAADSKQSPKTMTTTTTTPVPGSDPSTVPPNGSAPAADPSGVLSPSTPPDMQQTDAQRMNPTGSLDSAIDPAQVQKVFGMDVALIDLKTLNKDQVKQLQQRLQERGFYRGKVDGAMGPQTRNALTGLLAQQYALNQRLANQGQITEQFASSIGMDTRGRAPVTGVDRSAPAVQYPPANAPTPPNQ